MGRIAWTVTTATAAAVASSVWLIAGWGGESTLYYLCNYATLAFGVFATAGVGLATWWSRGRKRTAWA